LFIIEMLQISGQYVTNIEKKHETGNPHPLLLPECLKQLCNSWKTTIFVYHNKHL